MKFSFLRQRRQEDKSKAEAAKAETERAETEYRWTVQQRTTVQDVVKRVLDHGERNNIVENVNIVIRGGHK